MSQSYPEFIINLNGAHDIDIPPRLLYEFRTLCTYITQHISKWDNSYDELTVELYAVGIESVIRSVSTRPDIRFNFMSPDNPEEVLKTITIQGTL